MNAYVIVSVAPVANSVVSLSRAKGDKKEKDPFWVPVSFLARVRVAKNGNQQTQVLLFGRKWKESKCLAAKNAI